MLLLVFNVCQRIINPLAFLRVMKSLFVAAAILLAFAVFFSNFAVALSSPGYLSSLARSTSTWEQAYPAVGSPDVASSIAAGVVSYISGKSAAIAAASYFREEELSHLDDVRHKVALFRLFFYLTALAAFAAFLAVVSGAKNPKESMVAVRRLLLVSGASAAAVSIVLFLLSLNFGASFTGFHIILFSGGQWQFPSYYLLVNLFTEAFFSAVAKAAVAAAFAEGLAMVLASVLISKYKIVFKKPV